MSSAADALTAAPDPLDDTTDALPGAPGLYAWWAPATVLEGWSGRAHPRRPDLRALDAGAARMLRNRIRRQDLYRTGVSRLRRVLSGLLLDELALAPTWAAEVILPRADEDRLSVWMRAQLSLTWCPHETPAAALDEVVAALGPATAVSASVADDAEALFLAAAGEKVAPEPGVPFRRP